jgi:hypothetical protein
MSQRRRANFWLPCIVLLALLGVCFCRLVAHPSDLLVDGRRPAIDHADREGSRPLGNDLTFFLLPLHLSITRAFAAFGHLPLWDARGFGGRPLVGNPQAGVFYPPVWAAWWCGSPAALGWLTLAHLFWGGLGVYALLRTSRHSLWAATVGAGIYEASPYLLGHVFEGHYPHVWAACWYPWAFLALIELRAGKVRGFLALPVILALTYLTGHPQEWFFLILVLSIWQSRELVAIWRQRGPLAAGSRMALLFSALILSVGLTAIQAAPQWSVRPWLLRGHDSGAPDETPRSYHLHGLNGFQLLSPTALGGPADYFGYDNYWETLLSIGLVPLLLALTAVWRHPDRKLTGGWLALAGLALWYACGTDMVFYRVLYLVVPGVSWFRVPARSLFLANLACCVLAGMGVDTLTTALRSTGARRRLGAGLAETAGSVPLGIVVAASIPGTSFHRVSQAAAHVLHDPVFWFAMLATAVVVLVSHPAGRLRPAHASRVIGLLALGELATSGAAFIQTTPAARFLGPDPITEKLTQPAEKSPRTGPLRIKTRGRSYGDLAAVLGRLEKADINDLFQLEHAALLYKTLYGITSRPRPMRARLPMYDAVEDFRREVRQAVFNRMSVSYLVSDRLERDPDWPVVGRGIWGATPYVIQRNPGALARAYVVPRALVTSNDSEMVLPCFRAVDPRALVVTRSDPLGNLPPGVRQPYTPAEWLSADPDRLVIRVTTEAPGLLVVTDTWMPGWTAFVDGRATPILQGNLAQRVVPLVRGGTHTIVMRYRPPGLALGCAVTAVTALAWFALAALALRARRAAAAGHAARVNSVRGPMGRRIAAQLETLGRQPQPRRRWSYLRHLLRVHSRWMTPNAWGETLGCKVKPWDPRRNPRYHDVP